MKHPLEDVFRGLWIKDSPKKFNIEPENDKGPKGISFSRGPFSGSMLNFRGVFPGTTSQPPKTIQGW